MEPIARDGGVNPLQITIPAGPATRDISGAAPVLLTGSEGDSDLIELHGLITGNIVVTVPLSLFVMIKGNGGPYTPVQSWLKVFQNNTAGAFTVTVKGPTGVGAIVPQGQSSVLFSPDGQNVFVTSTGAAGPAGPAGTGIGLAVLYQPGGVFASNVVTTEAQLHAAVTAEFAAGGGPFVVAVDSSMGAATLAGAFNWSKRVSIVGANPEPALNVLAVTALQTDIASLGPTLTYQSNLPAAPTLAFSAAASQFDVYGAVQNLNAHAIIDVPAGQTLKLNWHEGATWSVAGAGAIVGLTTNTSVLNTVGVANPAGPTPATPAVGLVTGIAGSTWSHVGDRSWILQPGAGFLGTFTQMASDEAFIGAAGLQLGPTPKMRIQGSTVNAVALVIDTTFALLTDHACAIGGWYDVTDRTAQTGQQANINASGKNYAGFAVTAGTLTGAAGDGALATAVPSLSVVGTTLHVTFTPPAAYVGNLDWIAEIDVLQN